MGIAVIDHDRCLPWGAQRALRRLPGNLPRAHKAIDLTDGTMVANGQGGTNWMTRPVVAPTAASAAALASIQCPLEGVAAIRVERPSGIVPGAAADG